MADKFILVFNPTEYNQNIDAEGHVVEPHNWACAEREVAAPLIEAGSLFEVDASKVSPRKADSVKMAKQEVERRNAELKKDDKADNSASDDTSGEGTATTKSVKKK
jgi:hypothetical protein